MYTIISKKKVKTNLFNDNTDYIIYKDINIVYKNESVFASMNAYKYSTNTIIPELSINISYSKDEVSNISNEEYNLIKNDENDYVNLVNKIHIKSIISVIVKEKLFSLTEEDWEIK